MGDNIYIKWKSVYSLGIPIIDDQHQKWIKIFNSFHDAQQKGEGQLFIEDTLKEFMDYTKYHFSEEEYLFGKSEYPKAEEHIQEHKNFIRKLTLLQHDFKKNNLLLSIKTIDALKDWLIDHILGTDREFGEYAKNNKIF